MFDNVVALLGMPRSGTTIVSRLVANHSRIDRIIEPYHTRRDSDYREIDTNQLCTDFGIIESENKSLLVKETFTRPVNIECIGAMLEFSNQKGYRSAYIFVLRSPLEAFLSQVDAVTNLWQKKSNFSRNARSLSVFYTSYTFSMHHYLEFALRFHRRFLVYDRFVQNPTQEIGRLVGLFGYPLEQAQMDLSRAEKNFGGDPRARVALPETITEGDRFRIDEVSRMTADFATVPEFGQMRRLHDYVKEISSNQPSSEEIVRDLMLLLRRGRV